MAKIDRQKFRGVVQALLRDVRDRRVYMELRRETLVAQLRGNEEELDELAATEQELGRALEVKA